MSNLDDLELIKRIAKGEERALLELYDRYAPRVYGLALHIVKEPMTAEEVVQDTFFKIWEYARTYLSQRGSVLTWILTITRHTAIDRLRREARHPLFSNKVDPESSWSSVQETDLSAEEEWRSLSVILQSLPQKYRQVLELAYYQGLSQKEIAEVLGWPLGTVKTRLREGMVLLRRAWKADESKTQPDDVNV